MASTTSSSCLTESPFTETDSELFPPLRNPLPGDSEQFLKEFELETMSVYTQLQAENERLKAELVAMRSQRQLEQRAYGAFVRSSESLNAQLPPQARNPAMKLAFQELVAVSREYRNMATSLNQNFVNVNDLLPVRPPEPNSAGNYAARCPCQAEAGQRKQRMIGAIKVALAELHISCPPDLVSIDTALGKLNNNVTSFPDFMVSYLNGRHRLLISRLRSQIDAVIGGLFSDPDDARQILDKIMKVLKEGVKYTESEVQGIGADIIGPLGILLWALVKFLENET